MRRREFIRNSALSTLFPACKFWGGANQEIYVQDIKLYNIGVNERGNWYVIELGTNKGLTGLGECSHAHPVHDRQGKRRVEKAVAELFAVLKGQSIFDINKFRQVIHPQWDKIYQTVFSAFDQCLWDICGKATNLPVYNLLGGKLYEKVEVYANINRASNERDSNGRRSVRSFIDNAEQAVAAGFNAVKLAPFDEMKSLADANEREIETSIVYALNCIHAVRKIIGPERKLLIDVHSHLNFRLTKTLLERVKRFDLFWLEEPFDPLKSVEEMASLKTEATPYLAGGESIFGLTGFAEIFKWQSLDTVMPDVKHCGGITSLYQIASMAAALGIRVAPHNPSGPIATAASLAVCATMPSFQMLEYAYGEVGWSSHLIRPVEGFKDGFLIVSNNPGIGVELNRGELKKHLV